MQLEERSSRDILMKHRKLGGIPNTPNKIGQLRTEFSNASLANAAVFRSCWLEKFASIAYRSRMKDGEIVWIKR